MKTRIPRFRQIFSTVARRRARRLGVAMVALGAIFLGVPAGDPAADERPPIRIGVLATLDGAYEALGRDAMRGVEMALGEVGGEVAGRPIELVVEGTDGTAAGLSRSVGQLIGARAVELVVGPLTGAEGIILRDVARGTPGVTFVNGSAAAPEMTFAEPASNLFRFSPDVSQWLAGLGTFAYGQRGIRRVITVGEDYSFPYFQVFAFLAEFCEAGGQVVGRHWLPIGGNHLAAVVQRVSVVDADAIFLALEGADAVRFSRAYREVGGALPLIGGPVTVDEAFSRYASGAPDALAGTLTAGPVAGEEESDDWRRFADRYREIYSTGRKGPSLYALAYYINTRALLGALVEVDGQLDDGHEDLREALEDLRFDTPAGRVYLDDNRQAVITNYVMELEPGKDGGLVRRVVDTVRRVDQTLGLGARAWRELGIPGRNTPECS